MIAKFGNGTAVSVGTTPTLLRDSSMAGIESSRFILVAVPADATATIYIGGPGVTAASGIPLVAGESWSSGGPVSDLTDVYGIVASGTVSVRVLECA